MMGNKAFLIGVNTHGLQYSENDVELMDNCLTKHDYEIIKPYHKEKRSILEKFDEMLNKCDKTDTVICYFSGHGLLSKGKLCLVLDETQVNNKIRISEITEPLEDCRATNKLIILDCCHAGAASSNLQLNLSEAYRVLTASTRLERSKEIDEFKAGFLTYKLNQALANLTEINIGQKVTINRLYEWLVEEAKQHNARHSIQVPIPNLMGNAKANFEIATCSGGCEIVAATESFSEVTNNNSSSNLKDKPSVTKPISSVKLKKKARLEKHLENLSKRYDLVSNQREATLNEGDKIPLDALIEQLEKEIEQTEKELERL
ncbi:caspase family protein [Candidatus Halobeggiatoa sp. HSG11]|nr:caspase family protein [Candidatus Halobeggiatoa sp. HSG11]